MGPCGRSLTRPAVALCCWFEVNGKKALLAWLVHAELWLTGALERRCVCSAGGVGGQSNDRAVTVRCAIHVLSDLSILLWHKDQP